MNESYRLSQENLARTYQQRLQNMNNNNEIGVLDEKILVELLSITSSRQQALHYIDQNLTRNGNLLALLDRGVLFEQFHRVLGDGRSPPLQIQCTILIAKIIPLLNHELDTCMQKVLSRIVSNIGSTVKLQKESIQTIHVYMKHTADFQYIIHSLAYDGLRHKDKKTRHQVVVSFPALLFPEFRHKDFFDIVHTLVLNMDENYVEKEILRKVWKVLKEYLGAQSFNNCVDRLPNPLKTLLRRQHVLVAPQQHNFHVPTPSAGVVSDDDDDDDDDITVGGSRNLAWSPESSASPVLRPHGLRHRKSEGNINQFGISFVSKDLLEDLASTNTSTRVHAAERLKNIIESLQDVDQLRACLSPLVSILQPVVSDKNMAVVVASLQTIQAILGKIGVRLNSNLEMFVSIVLIQIASVNDTVRSECMKVCLQMMNISGVLKVVESMWKKFQLARYHAREEMVNVITAALLRWEATKQPTLKQPDITKLIGKLARLFMDKNPNVRLATFECFAVFAGFRTSNKADTLTDIALAISRVEMQFEGAFGLMSAVNSRIVRKLLPTLNKQTGLIEYSNFHIHASPQSADVQWVAMAGQVKKRGSMGGMVISPKSAESTHGAGSPFKQPTTTAFDKSTRSSADAFKKHLTKQSTVFPWTTTTANTEGGEPVTNKHPNSAPVQASRTHLKELPPVHPTRQQWESDGDLTSATSRNNSEQHVKHFLSQTQDLTNASSYRDLSMKKRGGQYSLKHSGSPLKRTGYKPSFAAATTNNNTSAAAATTGNITTGSSQQQQESLFSNSCPSSFFEMTTSKLKQANYSSATTGGMNKPSSYHHPPSPSVGKPTISSTAQQQQDEAGTIMMKPALVRSASKSRKSTTTNQQQQRGQQPPQRTRNLVDNLIMTSSSQQPPTTSALTSSAQQATPNTSEQTPQRGGHHNATPRNRSSTIFFNDADLSDDADDDVTNYTPTAVMTSSSSSTKPRLAKINNNHHHHQTTTSSSSSSPPQQRHQLGGGDVTTGSKMTTSSSGQPSPPTASHPSAVESKFMPHRHKMMTSSDDRGKHHHSATAPSSGGLFDKEFPEKSQMASIRRSAQDKRQRMLRSQPSNDILSSTMPHEKSRTTSSAQSSFRSGGMIDKSEFSATADESLLTAHLHKLNFNQSQQPSSQQPSPPTTTTTNNSEHNNNNTMTSPITKPKEVGAVVGVRMDYVDHNDRPLPVHSNDHNHFNDKFLGTSSSTSPFSTTKNGGSDHPATTINVQGRGVHFSNAQKKLSTTTNMLVNSAGAGVSKTATGSENNENFYQTWSPSTTNKRERKKLVNKTESFSSSIGSGSFPKHSNDELPLNDSSNNGGKRLENPERAMQYATNTIESADAEQWEQVTKSMLIIQRLSTNHPNVLATKFSPIIRLLSKQVSNLRSQVSRSSVVTIHSIYTNLNKPTVDIDLEVCVGALINEYGKTNVFMREEISKALNAILDVTTSTRFLATILNTGFRHKNKDVRNSTACYTSKLVNKIGCDKVFTREFGERIFEATASFIMDSSPDVRYHGKCIINEVMKHPRFKESLDQYLNKTQTNDVLKCVNMIQERGLTSSQSSGGYKRTYQRHQVTAPTNSSAQEPEEVREILARISKGDLQSKREGMNDLFEKVFKRPSVSDNSVKKIMDTFIVLYSTSNSKANLLALENSARLIEQLKGKIPRENLQSLLPVLFKLTASKHANLAKDVINLVISRVDNSLLVQPFANQAQYAHGRARQFAMEKLTELVAESGRNHVSTRSIQRHVFPVLWNAMTSSSSSAFLRREVAELARQLYELAPDKLMEEAEHKKQLDEMKQMVKPRIT